MYVCPAQQVLVETPGKTFAASYSLQYIHPGLKTEIACKKKYQPNTPKRRILPDIGRGKPKVIDPSGPAAICPECGFRHSFVQLPLLIVSGASGAGKSTVCHTLIGRLNHVLLLDSDILWRPEFNTPANKYREFFEQWLRMCKNVSQSGRPVVLFGGGAGVPDNIEPCIELVEEPGK